jgi:LEA14-like dessication related protein
MSHELVKLRGKPKIEIGNIKINIPIRQKWRPFPEQGGYK